MKNQHQPETESSNFLGHNKHTLEKAQLGGKEPPQSLSSYFFLPALPSQKWASELHHKPIYTVLHQQMALHHAMRLALEPEPAG